MLSKDFIAQEYKELQEHIISNLQKADGGETFKFDEWNRPGGGGGRAGVLINGQVIEKGGVNFSAVHGTLPEQALRSLKIEGGTEFFATGVSIVIHPKNPWVPIIHMNVRYFEIDEKVWWFGGGIDLTPHYVDKSQATYFHRQLENVCSKYHPDWYSRFKETADQYFFLSHREETRGIGGIFFDRMKEDSTISKSELFDFTKDLGHLFAELYPHLMDLNKDKEFGQAERDWQMLRRGRYVEFNLVHDRGTKFGLETNGRTESILMSLPPVASWIYDHKPAEGSKEKETLKLLKKGIDWRA